MLMGSSRFARGLIIGGLIGATVSMMNSGSGYRLRRRIVRAGKNVMNGKNGVIDAISDLF